jgi:hypothetical protein
MSGTPLHRTVDGLEALPVLHDRRITIPQAGKTILEILQHQKG